MRLAKFSASTLPELLVTLVVSGVALLLVFDGVDMVRTALGGMASLRGMDSGLEVLQRCETLCETSDSVRSDGDSLRFFARGACVASISLRDSCGGMGVADVVRGW